MALETEHKALFMDVMCLCMYKVIILEYTQTGVLLSS